LRESRYRDDHRRHDQQSCHLNQSCTLHVCLSC
jgi:hypothetical protein